MNYISLICARGGSQGLPKKNIRKFLDKPLIAWSIITAKNISRISRIIVSTDSEEIANIALEYGAEVPFIRPSELANNDSPEWLVWRHTIDYLIQEGSESDYALAVIPATAPLRSNEDIENCLDEFEKGNADIVITVTDADRSPYFNMVKVDKEGYSSLVIKPELPITRRQDTPEVFDITTVAYIVSPQFVMKKNSIFEGRVRSIFIPKERAIDIDTQYDFNIAELLANDKDLV